MRQMVKIWWICTISLATVRGFIDGAEIKQAKRTFEIDKKSGQFLKDGESFRYISGTIHYFRTLSSDWRDRLRKLRFAGCNAVQTYIEWASHEPESGVYVFEDNLDLLQFITIAQEEGLLVILRPGPYIDAERDMGGLPYWLLRENPKMYLRSSDSSYLQFVDRWYNYVFPMLKDYLYENGGPIIMLQVENEYGFYEACDFTYTDHLKGMTRSILGDTVVLFTVDPPNTDYLKCGRVADVYTTVDFGITTTPENNFAVQRLFEPEGPLVNTEFYSGWLDHWGQPHSTATPEDVASTLDMMLAMNASVNIYVFAGGTSFGLTSGSNLDDRFKACPTSYDFDAVLNEAGDPTEKYYAIRNVTEKYVTLPSGEVPGPSAKYAYGEVPVNLEGGILSMTSVLSSVNNTDPLTFEAMSVSNGIVVYSTIINDMIPDPARLTIKDVHDRGYVFVDNQPMGIASRELDFYDIPIFGKPGQTLSIVVESQGRVCFGSQINDFKGITTSVYLGSIELKDWEMTAIPLTNSQEMDSALDLLRQKNLGKIEPTVYGGMAFYSGSFQVPIDSAHPMDTFLRLDGWNKGYAWVNDFLLGRYWPVVGPQVTLYVPHSILKRGSNSIRILELEETSCSDGSTTCLVSFVDIHEVNGPTPTW